MACVSLVPRSSQQNLEMGRSGFIISPVIHDTYDFAPLSTKDCEQHFSSRQPTSVEIKGGAGTRLFWEPIFEVQLRRIEAAVQAGADEFAYDQMDAKMSLVPAMPR